MTQHKTFWISVFALVCCAQLALPASKVLNHFQSIQHGTLYKFKTAPVDPYDAFRGRYVALAFEAERTAYPLEKTDAKLSSDVYAQLDVDADGFAVIKRLSARPIGGEQNLKVRLAKRSGSTARIQLPFDRYYLDESIALKVERAYRDFSRNAQAKTYVTVSIKNHQATLNDLYLDDLTVNDWLEIN